MTQQQYIISRKLNLRLTDEEINIIHVLREQKDLRKYVEFAIEQLKNRKEFIIG